MIRIAPSILNANFDDLPNEIAKIASAADLLHLDIMDNIFVPNFTFSPERATAIIADSPLPVDVHLMIASADSAVAPYLTSKAFGITVHLEACDDPVSTLRSIRGAGKRSGLAIKPNTPIESIEEILDEIDMLLVMTVEPGFGGQTFMEAMMPKVEKARHWINQRGFHDLWIEVDGGISPDTIAIARKSGADTFVAGSSVYKSSDPAGVVTQLRAIGEAV